jgi:hypothetical protein
MLPFKSSAALLLFLAFMSVAPIASAAAQVDTPANTPSGASYLLPAGWDSAVNGDTVVLSPAEKDLRIAIVSVNDAADGRAAADAAWKNYRPDMGHPFKLSTARPPRNGWDEQNVVEYETSPADRLALVAIARRKAKSSNRWA